MISFLARLFLKAEGQDETALRKAYGVLCGAVGIALNVLLFLGKFFAGALSGSIAITADAFNNLSDAAAPSSHCWAFSWRGSSRTRAIPSATAASSTCPAWRCPC